MSLSKKLATTKFGVNIAKEFANSFSEIDKSYFMYFGKHVPYGTNFQYEDENSIVQFNAQYDVSGNSIFIANNTFVVGDRIRYYTDSNITAINGLTNNSIYYILSSNTDYISLAGNNTTTTPISITPKSTPETHYFTYASGAAVVPTTGDSVEAPEDSDRYTSVEAYDDMIFAKRIRSSDIALMVKRNLWTENTVYSQYDDNDPNLYMKPFFVVVDDITEYNVYKCLFNNNDSPSTEPPFKNGNSLDYRPFETSDKYIWKFMYGITKFEYEKFSTSRYIPLIANNEIIDNATPGTIDVIRVINGGSGYDNWFTGAFTSSDIRYLGSNRIYGLTGDFEPSALDDFYQGCVLKITNSQTPGLEGQYRNITSSIGIGPKKYVVLDSPFSTTPSVNDSYEIFPSVYIWGDGNETLPASARAIVNTNSLSGNSVSNIEVLSPGRNYRNAIANFILPPVVTDSVTYKDAVLQPIVSPPEGHGGNPYNELGARSVGVSVTVTETENGTIPANNDFRSVGIIKNPEFNNVILTHGTAVGSFSIGEEVVQYKAVKLFGKVETVAGSNLVFKTGNGQISSTLTVANSGFGYDHTINDTLLFDNADTGGYGARATFTANISSVSSITFQSNSTIVNNYIVVASNPYANGTKLKYYVSTGNEEVVGLTDGQYYYAVSANATHLRLSSNNNVANFKTISNSAGLGNSYLGVINGSIVTTTVVNRGFGYQKAPLVSINTDNSGEGALIYASLENNEITQYTDSLSSNDIVLITSGDRNIVGKVSSTLNDSQFVIDVPALYTYSNNEVIKVEVTARGTVYSVSTGQIGIKNVTGIFENGKKILGLGSYASSVIKDNNAVTINDKNPKGFNTALQLTRLVGNIDPGFAPFIEDEKVYQDNLISYAQPSGRVHSTVNNQGANNDVVYISREYGIFNRDPAGVREVYSDTSESAFTLLNLYPGDFVKGSGEIIYIENLDAISRDGSKSETVKIILEF